MVSHIRAAGRAAVIEDMGRLRGAGGTTPCVPPHRLGRSGRGGVGRGGRGGLNAAAPYPRVHGCSAPRHSTTPGAEANTRTPLMNQPGVPAGALTIRIVSRTRAWDKGTRANVADERQPAELLVTMARRAVARTDRKGS